MAKPFSQVKIEFDSQYENVREFDNLLPEHLTLNKKTAIKNKDGSKNEQYYKWQFLYALINSGLYAKDYIGTEVYFPKGNKNSAPIKFDCAIFDDVSWFEYYKAYHNDKSQEALDWLRKHIMAVVEIKKEGSKDTETVWNQQLKPALKESENDFCLGILYDTERLYLFKKHNGKFLRLNESYNSKKELSQTKDLQLYLTDAYSTIPTYEQLKQKIYNPKIDRSKRTIDDLEIISGVYSTQLTDGISSILRTMDRVSLMNQRGYEILIQMIALKIFDEKKKDWLPKDKILKYYIIDEENEDINKLKFYIELNERDYKTLNDTNVVSFTKRITELKEQAETTYKEILSESILNLKDEAHVKVVASIVNTLQDFSFTRSSGGDLWQLVFYQFANAFTKSEKAQFLTPIPLINFIVDIISPKDGETIIDPTSGSGDFLSVSYVKSESEINDKNIYGVDNDKQMVQLAQLNMLLNGDGRSILKFQSGMGSISHKFSTDSDLIPLIPEMHKNGNWDNNNDYTKLKKFDIVLTNPPFGEDRAFIPHSEAEKSLIECYETWNLYGKKKIDLGVVFLENAYRILKENGRMGIVLSNSIASIDTHKALRKWLMDKMRIVAIFDMPANIFGETGVNTTIIVAYKPTEKELENLKNHNYQIFSKDIQKIGYEVKTSQRVKVFLPIYKINFETFEIEIDNNGMALLDEDFTETITDFKQWCLGQEKLLQDIFIKGK
jgi:type I restriction enzyme M protein